MNNTSTKINNNLLTNLYKKEFHQIFNKQKKHSMLMVKFFSKFIMNLYTINFSNNDLFIISYFTSNVKQDNHN